MAVCFVLAGFAVVVMGDTISVGPAVVGIFGVGWAGAAGAAAFFDDCLQGIESFEGLFKLLGQVGVVGHQGAKGFSIGADGRGKGGNGGGEIFLVLVSEAGRILVGKVAESVAASGGVAGTVELPLGEENGGFEVFPGFGDGLSVVPEIKGVGVEAGVENEGVGDRKDLWRGEGLLAGFGEVNSVVDLVNNSFERVGGVPGLSHLVGVVIKVNWMDLTVVVEQVLEEGTARAIGVGNVGLFDCAVVHLVDTLEELVLECIVDVAAGMEFIDVGAMFSFCLGDLGGGGTGGDQRERSGIGGDNEGLERSDGAVGSIGEDESEVAMVASSLVRDDVGGVAFEPGFEIAKGRVVGLAFDLLDAIVEGGKDGIFGRNAGGHGGEFVEKLSVCV